MGEFPRCLRPDRSQHHVRKVTVHCVPPWHLNTPRLDGNLTFSLEHLQPPLRLFSTCFQRYFKPCSPAGSRFYLDIFLTTQRIISKPRCQPAAAPEHLQPSSAEQSPPQCCARPGEGEKGAEPGASPRLGNTLQYLMPQADTAMGSCRCKSFHRRARLTAHPSEDASEQRAHPAYSHCQHSRFLHLPSDSQGTFR